MKSIGSMFLLFLIVSLANTTWCGAQNPVVHSNQAATCKSPVLIDVEVRFIEVDQESLDQLGAVWNTESGSATTNSRSGDRQSSRTAGHDAAPSVSRLLSGSFLSPSNVVLLLNTLEQKTGANLLSAPKVTTRSGENAEIKVVKEIIYPTGYDLKVVTFDKQSGQIALLSSNESVSASNRIMSVVTVPKNFVTRDTGVILNVTPTASSDNKSIFLKLKPEVVEFVEWVDYGSKLRSADGSWQQLKMMQPVFNTRSLNSQITILDGQTVVMGGLIRENRIDDEQPSWFGRLFGSKPERKSVRINLLILVTARILDLAGKPIAQSHP